MTKYEKALFVLTELHRDMGAGDSWYTEVDKKMNEVPLDVLSQVIDYLQKGDY